MTVKHPLICWFLFVIALCVAEAQPADFSVGVEVNQLFSTENGVTQIDSVQLDLRGDDQLTAFGLWGEYHWRKRLNFRLSTYYYQPVYSSLLINSKYNNSCPGCPNGYSITGVGTRTLVLQLSPVVRWQAKPWLGGYFQAGLMVGHHFSITDTEGSLGSQPYQTPQVEAVYQALDQLPRRWYIRHSYGVGIEFWRRVYVQALYSRNMGSQFFAPLTVQGAQYAMASNSHHLFLGLGYRHGFSQKHRSGQLQAFPLLSR